MYAPLNEDHSAHRGDLCVFENLWVSECKKTFQPDASTPRTLSGVPGKSRCAATVGTQTHHGERPADLMTRHISLPLRLPWHARTSMFMVAHPWRKNACGRGALWSPVGTCVHSQRWRAFKDCSSQSVQFTRLAGGCDLISLRVVSRLCVQLDNSPMYFAARFIKPLDSECCQ